MNSTLTDRFLTAARLGEPDQVPVALIVDSPWLPGYAGIDTRDYFLFPEQWLQINLDLLQRFPEVSWLPGFWVEFGMTAEPSAFGCKMRFYPDRPPSIEPLLPDLDFWARAAPVNPAEDGLMPLALRLYRQMDLRLQAEGLSIPMVAARGPLTSASWLVGITALMEGLAMQPEKVTCLLETVTTSLIRWLEAQLGELRQPQGILLLDDLVGMVSRRTYQALVEPHLQRIFNHFSGMLRIYHNDTPCPHLLDSLGQAGFDVFNFSHQTDIALVKQKLGGRAALLGNVAPLELGVRGTPEQVYAAALDCLERAAPGGGLILSFGGGVSMGTPPENIDALVRAAREWRPK
ncbi:MAG: uroporphyrinogen decarboxylase family protein [Chloroflexota bacterium]